VLLGLLVALAADSPELTSALVAELAGKRDIGVGVLFGPNAFNIAALLGLSALVAGRVPLHRRVVVVEGLSAFGVALIALALVRGVLGGVAAAGATLGVFAGYVALSMWPSRLPLPSSWRNWLVRAAKEECEELSWVRPAGNRAGTATNLSTLGLSLVGVIVASATMERAASAGGSALRLPQAVVGGGILAAVTSLPNAVAALQLALSGKGPALLSEAMNSNTLNALGGLVLPAAAGGVALGGAGASGSFASASYVAMTLLALAIAYCSRGVGRRGAAALIGAYGAFLAGLVLVS
jgi:cation:H+ antiporter